MHLVTVEAACNHLEMGVQNVGLELQYKTCYARVLDSKRKFLQAATQYYELSQIENMQSGPGQVGHSHAFTAFTSLCKRRLSCMQSHGCAAASTIIAAFLLKPARCHS